MNRPLKFRALILYINERLKKDSIETLKGIYNNNMLYNIMCGLDNKASKKIKPWSEMLDNINGIGEEKDTRTDAEIERDVFKLFEGE